jgi:hypothetical protein
VVARDVRRFPRFLELPTELQIQVWEEAFSEPSIHFCHLQIRYAEDALYPLRWHPELRAISPLDADDSRFRRHKELAAICPSATIAVRPLKAGGEGRAALALDGHMVWMDKTTQILCIRFQLAPTSSSPYSCSGALMRPGSPSLRMVDPARTQEVFAGFEKVGIDYTLHWPEGWSTRNNTHQAIHCPIKLAGFIDYFPDIKEFLVVYDYRNSLVGDTIQKWFDQRKLLHLVNAPRLFSMQELTIPTLADDMKDLAIYAGRKTRYYEVHRRSVIAPCRCPLSPKCQAPMVLDRGVYKLLEGIQECLLDTSMTWKLPIDRRRDIKFTVLIKRPSDNSPSVAG